MVQVDQFGRVPLLNKPRFVPDHCFPFLGNQGIQFPVFLVNLDQVTPKATLFFSGATLPSAGLHPGNHVAQDTPETIGDMATAYDLAHKWVDHCFPFPLMIAIHG